jgi:hypothetical protein
MAEILLGTLIKDGANPRNRFPDFALFEALLQPQLEAN